MEEKFKTVQVPLKSAMPQVLDAIVKKRPFGWQKRSYAPYYKRIYAEWIKRIIDEMVVDRQPRLFDIRKFKSVSLNTLYLRVTQSLMFLLDKENEMDKDGRYSLWREAIHITKKAGIGVRISFDPVLESLDGEQPDIIKGDEATPKWKGMLDQYLSAPNPDGRPFYQGSLCLNEEQIEQLEQELMGLENVLFEISFSEVKVIKTV